MFQASTQKGVDGRFYLNKPASQSDASFLEELSQSVEERFQNFLKDFKDSNDEYKYRNRLARLASTGSHVLLFDFDDLLGFDDVLAKSLVANPDEYLAYKLQNPRLNQITFHTLRHFFGTMEYYKTKDILHV